jgi:hypothetical protein
MKITEMYKENSGKWKTRSIDYKKSSLHHILTDTSVFVNKEKEKKNCQSKKDRYLHELAMMYKVKDKIIYHSNILSVCYDTVLFVSFINKNTYILDKNTKNTVFKYLSEYHTYLSAEKVKYINNKYTPEYILKMMNLLNCLFLNKNICWYNDYFRLSYKNYSFIKYRLNFVKDSIEYLEYISSDKKDLKIRYDKEVISERIAELFLLI